MTPMRRSHASGRRWRDRRLALSAVVVAVFVAANAHLIAVSVAIAARLRRAPASPPREAPPLPRGEAVMLSDRAARRRPTIRTPHGVIPKVVPPLPRENPHAREPAVAAPPSAGCAPAGRT